MDIHEIEERYFQLRPDVFRFIVSQTYDPELAEDVLQETIMEILRIFRKGVEIREGTFRSFLYTIAYTQVKNHRRKAARQPVTYFESDSFIEAKPHEKDQSSLIYKSVQVALSDPKIPERTREVLRLRLIEELSIKEIMRILDISRQTFYRDLRIGMKILQETLSEKGITPESLK
ncbi:sigma-70 region 2 [Leptospira inadai serovar Lyme str. 10]|uniref:Sigma-70 region 2 n=2 Tax=Leptospira inadai serovar Lyme TaxID=293084 RepID=V6HXS6_9LEPT|nr:RNA polymerase sigma factor [Leptospira inadai]EQA37819.1 sigma-70 region 2 [Leptospira inadai serovar Lyme str. 10]PNV75143.1 hypothetical protein BES34_009610 [Leptospira inadai serovar Lyme]